MKRYVQQVLLGTDRLWNAIFGGSARETISSAVGRKSMAGVKWAKVAEKVIDAAMYAIKGQKNHCRNSIGI